MFERNLPECDVEYNERPVRDTERVLHLRRGKAPGRNRRKSFTSSWHPHGKRGAVGGQDRAKGAFGGCLTLKLAVNAELLWGNCIAMKNRQKIRLRRPETYIKLKF